MKRLLPILSCLFVQILYGQQDSCIRYFSGTEIYSIAEGKEAVWVATECRIVEIRKDTKERRYHVHHEQSDCYFYNQTNIIVDSMDRLWLGTRDGLYVLDSNRWKTIDKTSYISLLGIDRNNHVWYTKGHHELKRYDGSNIHNEIQSPFIHSEIAFDSANTAWVAGSGLVKFKDTIEKVPFILPYGRPTVQDVLIDSKGKIWIAGLWVIDTVQYNYKAWTFVACLDNAVWTIYNDSATIGRCGNVIDLKTDIEGSIWCLGVTRLVKFNGSLWTVEFNMETYTGNGYLEAFLPQWNGNQWVCTRGHGLFMRSDSNSSWSFEVTSNSGLPGRSVSAIEFDKDSILWAAVGGVNYGFVKFDGSTWQSFTDPAGKTPVKVHALGGDKQGNLWASNEFNLYKYDGATWKKFPVNLHSTLQSLAVDDSGHVWVGSSTRDLQKFDGKSWIEFRTEDYGYNYQQAIKHLDVDRDNRIWIGTGDHVANYNGVNWSILNCLKADGRRCWGSIQAIENDPFGTTWIGSTRVRGITKYDGKDYIVYKTAKQGTAYNYVLSIAADDKNVWIGTFEDGLLKYDGNVWMHFDASNSEIIGNSVDAVRIFNGQVWLGTNAGLIRFNGCGGDTITVTSEHGTGLLETQYEDKRINIYPNPFLNSFTVQHHFPAGTDLNFMIYDMKGSLVKQLEINSCPPDQFSVVLEKELEKGVYYGILRSTSASFYTKLIKM